jgi:peptidoglycan/LPS O-acetylase OafA/YrhL
MKYRAEIDGLRAFAVLSVVIFHAFSNILTGGFVGVDIFFVISGFLITTHIFNSFDLGHFSFTDFFQRRISRLFPSLITVMLCSLFFGWLVLLPDEFSQLGKHILGGAAFVSNFIFSSEAGYFDIGKEYKPMLHLWSLGVEEQFYIIWPIILWITWKIKQSVLLVTLLFLFISLSINLFFVESYPTEIFFWPFGRFWELLAGSVLAWFMLYKANFFAVTKLNNQYNFFTKFLSIISTFNRIGITTFIGLILLLGSVLTIGKNDPFPSYTAIVPVFGALLVIAGGNSSFLAQTILSNRLATWFGLISYPLYLWHWPVISYLYIIEDGLPSRVYRFLAVLLSILLAWTTFQFIEKPIRYGRIEKKVKTIILGILVSALGLIGLIISLTNFKDIKNMDDIYLRNFENRIAISNRWYKGLDDWLFLGNAYDQTVAKSKLTKVPSNYEINSLKRTFNEISIAAEKSNSQLALLVGPNKSSIYEEKLPAKMSLSQTRYVDFFLNELSDIDHLITYDPTKDLKDAKKSEGYLYYKTDTHWNDKGAYIAFKNILLKLGLDAPDVYFSIGESFSGDLIEISKIKELPVTNGDRWLAEIKHTHKLIRIEDDNFSSSNYFGVNNTVINSNPFISKKIWIVGDSFTTALKPYIEATFSEVRYLGHWNTELDTLATILDESIEKPDLILVVRAEREF